MYFCIADDDSLFIKFTGHLSYPFFKIEDRGSYFSFFFFIGTCIPLPLVVQLIFLLTIIFFSILFSMYINRTMKNKVEVDLAAYDLPLATEMYAKDSDTGEYKLYQTLYDGENRILLTSDQIPQSLRDAAVAIEDKRFYKHKGVDWKGTARAVLSTITGSGGS